MTTTQQHDATRSSDPTSRAIATLQDLEQVLQAEAEALRHLDFKAIDAATAHKERIESELHRDLGQVSPLACELAPEVRDLKHRVTTLARDNERRLRATLASIRGLLSALLGDDTTAYGPSSRGGPAPAAVLTSVIG